MPYHPGSASVPHRRKGKRSQTHTKKSKPVRKANRVATSKELRQTRGRILLGLSVVVALQLGVALLTSPLLAIRRETITGIATLSAADAAEVERVAAIRPGTNWLTASLSTVEQRLQQLPYIRYAVAKRVLPNAVVVRVGVREPQVIAEINGSAYEVDKEGVPLRIATAESRTRLETIALKKARLLQPGKLLNDLVLLSAMEIAAKWRTSPATGIRKIEVDQNDDICLNMQDGVTVALGQNDELTEKLARLHDIYKQGSDIGQKLAAINLTVPSAPAVILRNVVPPASTTPEITGNTHPLNTL